MPYGQIQVDTVKDSLNNTLAPSSAVLNAQVYLVSNKLNGKQYVGQTINPHLPIGHGRILKSAYKLHGKDNFTYEPICKGINNRSSLNAIERFWISAIDTITPNGYNIDLGGSEGSIWTNERKERISIARTGKKLNRPLGSKSGMAGKAYPEEGKRKLSEALKGRIGTNFGKIASEETKAKMSASQKEYWATHESPNKGRKHSEETKAKMRASRAKRIYTDEDKQKISEAVTAWHKQRKEQA
jgi:group I intron endonuclease